MKLLCVDDEFFIRERILRRIPWKELGIGEIATAENGEEALAKARELRPEILITDVRMPRMDGIELAERFKLECPDSRVIFISGYSDIPYLRSAIRLRAVSYVEKPIDMAELEKAVRTAKEEIEKERSARTEHEYVTALDRISRKAALARALSAPETPEEEIRKALADLPEARDARCYVCSVTRLIDHPEGEPVGDQRLYEMIGKITGEEDGLRAIGFSRPGEILLHWFCPAGTDRHPEAIDRALQRMSLYLPEGQGRCFHMLGSFQKEPGMLRRSCQDALACATQCFYHDAGTLQRPKPEQDRTLDVRQVRLSDFDHAIREEKPRHFLYLLDELAAGLRRHDATSVYEVKQLYYQILLIVYRAADGYGIRLGEDYRDEYRILDRVNQCVILEDLHRYAAEAAEDYYGRVRNNYTDNVIVNRVISYVEKKYPDPDLSVTQIAEALNLSAAYIGRLFRDTTGDSLTHYLTRIRMRKAEALIRDGRFRVKDVAQMVGYSSASYFVYRFRKEMGYTPGGSGREDDPA